MRNYIPSLNGLRALSIFSVLLVHINIQEFSNAYRVPLLGDRELGVNVFFILSGFLITTLLLQEEKLMGAISLKDFYLRRVFRIFPVYYVLLLVYLVLQLAGILHFKPTSWLTSLTYTKYFNWSNDWESAHLWSLSVEEHFYLIWPFIFKYFRRYRVSFAWAMILLVPILRIVYIKHPVDFMNPLTIFQKGDALMWGCIFAIYRKQIDARISKIPFIFAGILLLLLCLDRSASKSMPLEIYQWTVVPFLKTTGTIGDLAVGALILSSISRTQTVWYQLLNLSFMNYIGKLSYSLYIWQQLFFSHAVGLFGRLPLNLLLIFAVANISYYFIEKPFLRLKGRREVRTHPASAGGGKQALSLPVADAV
ncbi:MAG TPA: acyltransferase [Puia sp.]|nr:acyltransferase [Puia sp.]